MAQNMVQYLHFRILKFPLKHALKIIPLSMWLIKPLWIIGLGSCEASAEKPQLQNMAGNKAYSNPEETDSEKASL